jgi:hypothetical protein
VAVALYFAATIIVFSSQPILLISSISSLLFFWPLMLLFAFLSNLFRVSFSLCADWINEFFISLLRGSILTQI